jgi:hypothetical protein
MTEQYVVVLITASVLALSLVLVAAILNRARTPEHDLRRRALAIVAGFGGAPTCAALGGSSTVAVVMVVAWAVVVVAGLHLVLRGPSARPPRRQDERADRGRHARS